MFPRKINLEKFGNDEVGFLSIYQCIGELFPVIKRAYWIKDVPNGVSRGFHSHNELKQVLVCLQGTIEIKLENLEGELFTFTLNKYHEALFVPEKLWREMTFLNNAILLCLASEEFSELDYIRDYNEFNKIKWKYLKKGNV